MRKDLAGEHSRVIGKVAAHDDVGAGYELAQGCAVVSVGCLDECDARRVAEGGREILDGAAGAANVDVGAAQDGGGDEEGDWAVDAGDGDGGG